MPIFFLGGVRAHPDGALPVDHPLVIGFERFFAEDDEPEYLATGGLLLISRLGCTACHQAPPDWLGVLQPDLAADPLEELGQGLGYPALWLAIRNPPASRNGARMPEMFAHPARDPERVAALASFLYVKGLPELDGSKAADRWGGGDVDRGREIYHRVGCVACHAPEVPKGWDKPNVNSITLAVAESYSAATVARILSAEAAGRSRHPDFELSAGEIKHLVAYLRMPGVEGVGIDPALLAGEPQPAAAGEGRRLFREMGCSACHQDGDPGGAKRQRTFPAVALLSELMGGGGCVAPEPQEGIPFFGVSELQRQAIAHALARVTSDPEAVHWTADEAFDLSLAARNCYACHGWREKGGLEEARAVLMGDAGGRVPALGDLTDGAQAESCRVRCVGNKRHSD